MIQMIKNLFAPSISYKTLVQTGAVVIDVRTPEEFREGHIKGSMNIPLDLIKNKIAEIKQLHQPVITVCRSGARSSIAKTFLSSSGITAYNGGAWTGLQRQLT